MNKHTSGDWFAKREGQSTIYIEAGLRPGVLQEVAACGPTEAGREQQEANARLISAAPQLLEAVRLCLKKGSRWHPCDPALKAAQAALAKATGE